MPTIETPGVMQLEAVEEVNASGGGGGKPGASDRSGEVASGLEAEEEAEAEVEVEVELDGEAERDGTAERDERTADEEEFVGAAAMTVVTTSLVCTL
mmetsp:Transcript_23580/g.59039  ORF Transcript_23580/g.59039 Transcript_23580/m.59039 type:complete len:97 (+) Transcript_23580:1975-2265(+)